MILAIAIVALGAWIYLLAGRGLFWLGRERDDGGEAPEPGTWPSVAAIVPARDEADVVGHGVSSLRDQDYPGPFRIILVDDNSGDGTAEAARAASGVHSLTVIPGAPMASGWTGKLWAQSQGVAAVAEDPPRYLLFTDADIAHQRVNLRRLVARAEAGELVLTSLMARLTVRGWWERLLIPAFIFFFQMLYPFAWVNDPRRKAAAAAGGCMLVRREALERAGGLTAIRGRIIDDCALAALLKGYGPIWLGLTKRAWSLRPYQGFGPIARMVARSAYAQLNRSPLLLAGVVLGMALVYAAPPILTVFAHGPARWIGLAAWVTMAVAYWPTLRLYGLWGLWGATLPLAGAIYGGFTVWSAVQSLAGPGRSMEGPRAGFGVFAGRAMSDLASGKDHRDENFPVASMLIARPHRAAVMAFYRVARMADDIADHETASAGEKLGRLAAIQATLQGHDDKIIAARDLREVQTARDLSPNHILDLLEAFRRDVRQSRYADWGELMDYCRLSAAPVGRFVLDVHGQDETTWPASDALCAALQVINHLQDCGKDFRALDRVYIPLDALGAAGVEIPALGLDAAPPNLRGVIAGLAESAMALLETARPLIGQVSDGRLALEIGVIHRLAHDLARRLKKRDPLSERVHHRPYEALAGAILAAAGVLAGSSWGLGKASIRRHRNDMIASAAAKAVSSAQSQAAGSSFYSAMRLLPKPERSAMFAIYAFCREVDDVADEPGPTAEERTAVLDVWRRAVDSLYAGGPTERVRDLADPVRRYGLAKEDFLAVIDGMQMDIGEPIRRPPFGELDLYCDRVASAVGRLSVRVFGMEEQPGKRLAHHLGRALQFTNILRDLDEDAAMGRLYLPDEALTAAGIEGDEPTAVISHQNIDKAGGWLAAKAHENYRVANAVLSGRPVGRLRTPRLMSAVYRAILKRMEKASWRPPRNRVSLGKARLAWILATRGLGR